MNTGIRRGDENKPGFAILQIWGPDGQSRRMALWNWLRGSSFGPQSWGAGPIAPMAGGSVASRTKQSATLPPQQAFRGLTAVIANPPNKTLSPVTQLPSAGVATNPLFLTYDIDHNAGW